MSEQITRILDSIIVPGANRSLVQLGLVRSDSRQDGRVEIELGDAALMDDVRQSVIEHVRVAVAEATGESSNVQFVSMTPEEATTSLTQWQ